MLALVASGLVAAALAAPSGAAVSANTARPAPVPAMCPYPPAPAEPRRLLISGAYSGERRLLGDWEPPDALFVAVRDDWIEPLSAILLAAVDDIELVLMSDRPVLPEDLDALIPAERRQALLVFGTLHDSPWVRDYGPLQVDEGGQPLWLDFIYRGERQLDDGVPALLAKHLGIAVERHELVLEGGALIGNGRGLCAMTETSLADTAVTPDEPEAVDWLLSHLGCQALAVLPALPGEPTGHADMVAQFLGPHLVAVAQVDAAAAPLQAVELEHTVQVLRAAAAALGQPLEVLRLPLIIEGETFFSYVNGTRLARYYLVPSFSRVPVAIEEEAYALLDAALPDVELVPVPSDQMISLGGAVHCMTVGLRLRRG